MMPVDPASIADLGEALTEALILLGPIDEHGRWPAITMQPLMVDGMMGWKLSAGDVHSLFHGRLADALRCLADGLRQPANMPPESLVNGLPGTEIRDEGLD